jgi:predicted DNA binding CopG/RHH family protein
MSQKMKMPKIVPKNLTVDQNIDSSKVADKIITELRSDESKGDIQRITVDMPKYLYDIMKDKMSKKGYSMKTYIVGLVRKDVGDEE